MSQANRPTQSGLLDDGHPIDDTDQRIRQHTVAQQGDRACPQPLPSQRGMERGSDNLDATHTGSISKTTLPADVRLELSVGVDRRAQPRMLPTTPGAGARLLAEAV
jgi:hypothetical protein